MSWVVTFPDASTLTIDDSNPPTATPAAAFPHHDVANTTAANEATQWRQRAASDKWRVLHEGRHYNPGDIQWYIYDILTRNRLSTANPPLTVNPNDGFDPDVIY